MYLGEPNGNEKALLRWKLSETGHASVRDTTNSCRGQVASACLHSNELLGCKYGGYGLDQLKVEKPGGSWTLLIATYAIVALRTWRDNLDRCAAQVSWTRSVVQYHLCSFPAPSGSLHSVLPPVGYRTQVRCGGQIKSRGSHVR